MVWWGRRRQHFRNFDRPGGFTTILGATNKLATETLSSPTTQLMVMFNPDRPEQLGRIRKIINEVIDTPARQIVIEAMVLEITSSGLEELGLQWNFQKDSTPWRWVR